MVPTGKETAVTEEHDASYGCELQDEDDQIEI